MGNDWLRVTEDILRHMSLAHPAMVRTRSCRWSIKSGYPRMLRPLTGLVLELKSDVGRTSEIMCKKKKKMNQLLRAPSSGGRRNSTRVDEGGSRLLTKKMKACTVP